MKKHCLLLLIIIVTYRCAYALEPGAAGDTAIATQKAVGTATVSLSKADESFTNQYYSDALNSYARALSADSTNPNLNFKVAISNLYLLRQPKLNIRLLKTAIANFEEKYSFYSNTQHRATVDAFYFLGKSFMYDGQIDSGMQYLVYYQNLLRDNLPLDAARQLKMCINAKQLMKRPREVNVKEVGQPVNSDYDERRPVISLDNKVLFFASRRPDKTLPEGQLHDDDIYFSLADNDGKFGTPQAFPFNTEFDEEPVAISSNGNTLYLRRANKKGVGDIFYSEKNEEKWSAPKKMKGVNSGADEQGLSISNDGTMMVVCSNRPGGYGGYDLYLSTGKDGHWGALKNLSILNTEMDEISPFIFPGGKRVYFSSNGNTEYGMGGFDIFFAEPDSGGKKWSRPFTMGYPINTSGNEFDYVLGSQGRTLYTAVGKNGDLDLYDITAGEFKPEIQDQLTEVVATSGETQTVAVVEVEKEKKVEVEKEVEVSKIQEVEKDVEKNVGFVNADEAKKLDKVVAVQKEEVEVQNIVETEKLVYTNQSQHTIDSLNGIAATEAKSGSPDTVQVSSAPADFTVTTNVSVNPNNETKLSDGRADNAPNASDDIKATPVNNDGGNSSADSSNVIVEPVTSNVSTKAKADNKNDGAQAVNDETFATVTDKSATTNSNSKTGKKDKVTKTAEEKNDEESDKRAENVIATMNKKDLDALIKKIKEDLTKEMNEKRTAVFKTLYFNFNSDEVQLESYELKILVDYLKEHKDVNIEVVGHTDNRGSWESNFWISRQRAKSVYDYLVSCKIATSRIIFNGKGAIIPVADNRTSAGRAQNRRVEITLIQ